MKSVIGKVLLFLGLAAGAATAVNCSTGSSGSSGTASAPDVGAVNMQLKVGRTSQINKVNFTLTGPGGFTKAGSFDVSHLREAEGQIQNIPVGSPYTLALSAASTDGNVTCTGSKSGISVTCPGNRPQDEKLVKMTCTRNHVGREWGDRDWRSNARTFFITAEVNLDCQAQVDACAPDANGCSGFTCGTASDGCGGSVSCGTCQGTGNTCVVASGSTAGTCSCVSQPVSVTCGGNSCGTAVDNCGKTVTCGTCTSPNSCVITDGGTAGSCGCVSVSNSCGSNNCGAGIDNCGKTVSCGGCVSPNTCVIADGGTAGTCSCVSQPVSVTCGNNTCGTAVDNCGRTVACGSCSSPSSCLITDGGTAGSCGCVSTSNNCGSNTCGTGMDNCGKPVSCGPACPSGSTCSGNPGTCQSTCISPPTCGSNNCGQVGGGPCPVTSCGTCGAGFSCSIPSGSTAGMCQCVAQSPAVTCGSNTCGTAVDNCGNVVNCGSCTAPNTCGITDGGTAGKCSCVDEPVSVTCGSNNCGTAVNNCGHTVTCGPCAAPNSCVITDGGTAGSCTCVHESVTAACGAGNNCGTAVDNCGTTVTCGTCPAATPTCRTADGSTAGMCVCIPLTPAQACGANNNCGTASNGCGGTINCGTCPSGQTCSSGGGSPGVCGCVVTSNNCGASNCGSGVDNCGNPVSCGTCTPPLTCVSNGGVSTCQNADPCGITSNTLACLQAQDKTAGACSQCVVSNGCLDVTQQGGACEDATMPVVHFSGTLPDGRSCTTTTAAGPPALASASETEKQVCLQTLGTVFTSKCAATLQETPCLCGATDATACLSGTATPTGSAFDLYVCDFNTTSVSQIQSSNFTVQTFGAGMANALVQCAAAFNCPCF